MKFDWKMLLDEILQSVIKEQLEKLSKSKRLLQRSDHHRIGNGVKMLSAEKKFSVMKFSRNEKLRLNKMRKSQNNELIFPKK